MSYHHFQFIKNKLFIRSRTNSLQAIRIYGPVRIATANFLFVHEYRVKFFILAMLNDFKVGYLYFAQNISSIIDLGLSIPDRP